MLGNTQFFLLVLGIALTVLVIVKLNEIDSKLLELQNSQSEPPQDLLQKMFRPITHPSPPVQKSNKDYVDESDSDDDEPERIKEEQKMFRPITHPLDSPPVQKSNKDDVDESDSDDDEPERIKEESDREEEEEGESDGEGEEEEDVPP